MGEAGPEGSWSRGLVPQTPVFPWAAASSAPRPGPPAAQCALGSLETSVLYVALGLARATRPSQAPQAEGLSLSAPSAQTTEGLNERGSHVARVRVGGRAPGAPPLRSWPACVPACEVHFENTRVPVENVLGEVGGGFKVRCLPFRAASCYPGREAQAEGLRSGEDWTWVFPHPAGGRVCLERAWVPACSSGRAAHGAGCTVRGPECPP